MRHEILLPFPRQPSGWRDLGVAWGLVGRQGWDPASLEIYGILYFIAVIFLKN